MQQSLTCLCECSEAISSPRSPQSQAPSHAFARVLRRLFFFNFIAITSLFLFSCAEPADSDLPDGPQIPSIDSDAYVSVVTWNIEKMDRYYTPTTGTRVAQILDSLNADIYCLQEIEKTVELSRIIDDLDQFTVIISEDTWGDNLAIVYKHDSFLPMNIESLFKNDDYNFASRPPLLVSFGFEMDGKQHQLNVVDLHMKCCERYSTDLERRHAASEMLHNYMEVAQAYGDSNFVVLGDWNDDIYDPDGSGEYAFEAFLNDSENFQFVTDSLASLQSVNSASYPSWPSFLDNILVSRSLFDEIPGSKVETLRLDEIFGDYGSAVSDHRPVVWSFKPQ